MKMTPGTKFALLALPLIVVGVAVAAMSGLGRQQTITTTALPGTLVAHLTVGPLEPSCQTNATMGPAGSPMSSVKVTVTSSNNLKLTFSVPWQSDGCDAFGTVTTTLSPGSYSLTLSSTCCGARMGIPRDFTITGGQTTTLDINVDTGIR